MLYAGGKPTTHIAYDDATAILAGDGLQALALQLLAQGLQQTDPVDALALVSDLTQAVGFGGMVGGQMLISLLKQPASPLIWRPPNACKPKKPARSFAMPPRLVP